jgi:hypothetical protein
LVSQAFLAVAYSVGEQQPKTNGDDKRLLRDWVRDRDDSAHYSDDEMSGEVVVTDLQMWEMMDDEDETPLTFRRWRIVNVDANGMAKLYPFDNFDDFDDAVKHRADKRVGLIELLESAIRQRLSRGGMIRFRSLRIKELFQVAEVSIFIKICAADLGFNKKSFLCLSSVFEKRLVIQATVLGHPDVLNNMGDDGHCCECLGKLSDSTSTVKVICNGQ